MTFSVVNSNGAHYAQQLTEGEVNLDVFEVFGLSVNGRELSHSALTSHFRKTLMLYVFERGSAGSRTQGSEISTWSQVNTVKDILWRLNQEKLAGLQIKWRLKSQQIWNPFADPGSPNAFVAAGENVRRESFLSSFYASELTLKLYVISENLYVVENEHDTREANTTRKQGFASGEAAGQGSWHNPFFFDDDEEDNDTGETRGQGSWHDPFVFDSDEEDNATKSAPGSSADSEARSHPSAPSTASSASPTPISRQPDYVVNPVTPSRRRFDPRGILLETWKGSELSAVTSNAVYGSRDVRNRINRRISKESPDGRVMMNNNYNRLKTACKHEKVDYVTRFRGMTDDEVKAHIMSLLVPELGTYVSITSIRLRALAPAPVFTSREVRFFDSDSTRG